MTLRQHIVGAVAALLAAVARLKRRQLLKMELLQQSECANLARAKKNLVQLVWRNRISEASAEIETETGTGIILAHIRITDVQR
jgi:hypothetical protein